MTEVVHASEFEFLELLGCQIIGHQSSSRDTR